MLAQFVLFSSVVIWAYGLLGKLSLALPTTSGAFGLTLLILLVTYSRVSKSKLDKDSLSSSGWFSKRTALLASSYFDHFSALDVKL